MRRLTGQIPKRLRIWRVQKNTAEDGGVRYSISEIVDKNGNSYGIGVQLDSDLLTGLDDAERKQMVKLYVVEELAGQTILTYDGDTPAEISFAQKNEKFRNEAGQKKRVLEELYRKKINQEVKQEAVVLADELIAASQNAYQAPSAHRHEWLDDNGKNDWDKRTVYLQDKNKTIWEAALHIANTTDGRKILYDIVPKKKAAGAGLQAPTTTDNSIASIASGVNNQNSLSSEGAAQGQYGNLRITGADVKLAPLPQDAQQASPVTQGPPGARLYFRPWRKYTVYILFLKAIRIRKGCVLLSKDSHTAH